MGHFMWDQRFGRKRDYHHQEAVEHCKRFPGEGQDASGTGAGVADGEGNGYDSSEDAESAIGRRYTRCWSGRRSSSLPLRQTCAMTLSRLRA
ncbi:hypothetical protein HBH69_134450 [Parastagonospora nodorum]|nr:hypothetical protein HBH69_134450 [Parastagonospora nodorum]